MRRVPRSVVALLGLVLAAFEARAADQPKVWSVVIGINKYEDTLIPRCSGATRDAKAVADWLAETLGWTESGVLRLNDLGKKAHGAAAERSPDLYPNRENLEWAIGGWLGERVRPDDVVVIYFAGQAAARPPLPGATAGRAYILPIDARAADLAQTGWSLDDALDRAGTPGKAKVVIWLDTSTRGRGQGGPAEEPGSPSGLDWLGALTRWEGVTAWLAADGRPAPEDGAFVAGLRKAMGRPEGAHNLMGSLDALRDDKAMAARGFRSVGGLGPAVSLWSKGVLPVEKAQAEMIVQAGHGDRVTAIQVCADGDRVVTGSMDSTVRVWKLGDPDPAVVRILTDPMIGVRVLALDREGRLLVAGDGSGGIVGWDMAADRPKSIPGPRGHEAPIAALAFLPEGLRFVSLDEVGRSILWDGSGGVIRQVRPFSEEPLTRLAASARPGPDDPAMVAAVAGDGGDSLRSYDGRGVVTARFAGPGGRITALDLSAEGRLAVGDDRGRVQVVDLPGRTVSFRRTYRGPVSLVRLSKAGALLVADDQALHLVEPRPGGSDVELVEVGGEAAPGRVERATFSNDGRWLAACTRTDGRALAWRLADPARPAPVAIPGHDAPGLTPAFSPDGRMLVLGDQDGGLGAWSLEDGPEGPRAATVARVRPSRGKVAALSPSPTGRYLLEVTKDDVALIWDLEQGRSCRPLPGTWSSGAFLPDESRLVMTRRADRGGGDLVLVDRVKGDELRTVFRRPVDVGGRPLAAAFGRVVVSKSGRWVAAASHQAQLPLACVWEVETGNLVHTARILDAGLTALDFSGDEAYLLTASDDGTAKLWPLADPATELRSPAVTFFSSDPADPAISAARISPNDPLRVATGSRGGQVSLWRWKKGKPGRLGEPTRLGEPIQLNGEVNALAFSPDGRWLAASGANDKTIRFLDVSADAKPVVVEFKPRLHHAEQVGSLMAWPGGSMIVSGGDDAAIRFWDLKDRALVGTLIAQSRGGRGQDVHWLAFTPDGRFDGSPRAEPMVKWRVGEKIVSLQQTEDTHYAFQVAAAIARGDKPRVEAPEIKAAGPALKILAPPAGRRIEARQIELTLWSGDPHPPGLRLYHNGVPIRGSADFQPGDSAHFARAVVQLRKGENRLYAMASRPGSVNGRSKEVVLRYDGPEPSGRLHTLALGISDYDKRALKYAHVNARGISAFLGRQGIRGADKPGEQIVLVDRDVNAERIEDAFRRLRAAVAGRPEDTVVLFVAGHTDTDERANQFCLLLPRFPFKGAPAPLAGVADPNFLGVAMRGDAGGAGVRFDDLHVLPYAFLYNRLARLEALQRLVIVDACQAGAILDDRAVLKIQANVERGSRKARNSYLLAARRGEPANEVDALEHGLLTYTLLTGMGAEGLKAIPADLGGFPGPPSADLDKDGVVSSDELVAFADDALPQLAQMFPKVVLRAGGPIRKPVPGEAPPELERKLRLQSDRVSFPLILHP